jgi:hypothetical protein
MAVVNKNRSMYQGETIPWEVTCVDSSGTAVDITGYTFYFTVKNVYDNDTTDVNALLKKTITNLSDPGNGIFQITFDAGDTQIAAGVHWYDIRAKDTNSKVVTIQSGTLEVKAAATRRANT